MNSAVRSFFSVQSHQTARIGTPSVMIISSSTFRVQLEGVHSVRCLDIDPAKYN